MTDRLGKPVTQRQLRVGEMIKQALSMIFIKNEAKIPNLETNSITVTSSDNPTNKNYIDVYINGVYQAKANFSALAGKTLTLASGNFPNGAVIEAVTTT